jgi:hypothetical protein
MIKEITEISDELSAELWVMSLARCACVCANKRSEMNTSWWDIVSHSTLDARVELIMEQKREWEHKLLFITSAVVALHPAKLDNNCSKFMALQLSLAATTSSVIGGELRVQICDFLAFSSSPAEGEESFFLVHKLKIIFSPTRRRRNLRSGK